MEKRKRVQQEQARGRRKGQHKLSILLITGVLVILGGTVAVASIPLHKQNRSYMKQEAELKKQLEKEAAYSEEIDELEEYVGTDEFVEDVAKDKLGLVYPNEILFEAEP